MKIKLPGFGSDRPWQTEDYRNYLASPAWQRKRQRIIQKRRKCEHCGETQGLQVHHLNYDRLGQEEDEDLELLCKDCHEIADEQRAEATRHSRARDTYISKKYGDSPPDGADEEFDEWLEHKQEED